MPARERSLKKNWRSDARSSRYVAAALRRLGRRIREVRLSKGLTQEQAAERAGLDAKHYQTIESGRTNVTVASLVGVARSLGVPLATLFERT